MMNNQLSKPQTIDELKNWYIENNLPPEEVTRFYIGTDYKYPRAFGIYYDNNTLEYVVYKNKNDGTRVIRYQGKNEAYAVNELYIKLVEEIYNQKRNNSSNKNSNMGSFASGLAFTFFLIIFFTVIILCSTFNSKSNRYYKYHNKYYYYYENDWYSYDDYYGDWYHANPSHEFTSNYNSYVYDGTPRGIKSFYSSSYYHPSSSSSSDSSSSWDSSDSWDSSSTDWDSDW